MTSLQPPNSPAARKVVERGEIQHADGYAYWATAEDEAAEGTGRAALAAKAKADTQTSTAKPKAKGSRIFVRLLLTIAVALLAYFAASVAQVYGAAGDDETQPVDAIVVLGAAQFDGTPSPVFEARLEHAYQLWEDGLAAHIITTGSKQEGAGYVYLLERGVPEEDLITIVDGGDTWDQLSASANQLNERELESVMLVSDGYHNYRLKAIAEEVGIEAFVSPTAVDGSISDYVREGVAVSVGRVLDYRRVSAFNNPDN